ncbi:MAG: SDR family oxidoreductase [Candidatus Aenigmarchaeota archaeon]|nr:SDR family oxidoreductase [Candidatus Aenigmarchaeota archaeon]
MRVLITGGSGVIGSKFVTDFSKNGHDVLYTYLSRIPRIDDGLSESMDITDRGSVNRIVDKFRPDLIVHCSALTKVDLCETKPELSTRINVDGTKNIVVAGKNVGCKIIYISTAHVFYESEKVFYEDDKPSPQNKYGLSKMMGEEIIKNSGLPFMIFRTDHPYRWSPAHIEKNNVMTVIRKLGEGKEFTEAVDWYNMPTLVDNLVESALKMTDKWEDGIYHVVGSDYVSRYDFASKVAAALGVDDKIIKKTRISDLKLDAKRPNIRMNNDKIQKKSGVRMVGVDEGIFLVMKERLDSLRLS